MQSVDCTLARVTELVFDDCLAARITLYQMCAYSELAVTHSQRLLQSRGSDVSPPTALLLKQVTNRNWIQERCARIRNLSAYLARSSRSVGSLPSELRQAWVEDFVDSTCFLNAQGRTLLECFALFAEAYRREQWPVQRPMDGSSMEDAGIDLVVEAVAASMVSRPELASPWPEAQSIPRDQLDIDAIGAEVFTLTGRRSKRVWVSASADGQVSSAVFALS